jgi:hypothetical protein
MQTIEANLDNLQYFSPTPAVRAKQEAREEPIIEHVSPTRRPSSRP